MNWDPTALGHFATADLVAALKAVAEPTRLRILVLLRTSELNVKDLTQILNQSQPRLSRHLKLLSEAGLVERFREGSWVYFHISERTVGGRLALSLLETISEDDPALVRDRRRMTQLKRERELAAQDYFKAHAGDWDRVRSLHVAETEVEHAMRDVLGAGPFKQFVDLGTGTGRVLELFQPAYETAIGIDVNTTMLSYARSKLENTGTNDVHMRHADIYNLPLPDGMADAVAIHQVLHYLSDPPGAVFEAARIVKPSGRLLIVDFAPHGLEFLREKHAHERLGFSRATIEGWMREAGIEPIDFRELPPAPENADNNLTVSLWLGQRPDADRPARPSRRATQNSSQETV